MFGVHVQAHAPMAGPEGPGFEGFRVYHVGV